MKCTVGTQNL